MTETGTCSTPGATDSPQKKLLPGNLPPFCSTGCAAFSWDRRGFGKSSGTPGDYFSEARDARSALAMMRGREELDPGRIAVFGQSAGMYVATLLAREGETPALYILSGGLHRDYKDMMQFNYHLVRDFAMQSEENLNWVEEHSPWGLAMGVNVDGLFQAIEEGRDHYVIAYKNHSWTIPINRRVYAEENSPKRQFRFINRPTLVIHAENDLNVPPQDAFHIAKDLARAGVDAELKIIPGADHSFQEIAPDWDARLREKIAMTCFNRPYVGEYFQAMTDYLDRKLGQAKTMKARNKILLKLLTVGLLLTLFPAIPAFAEDHGERPDTVTIIDGNDREVTVRKPVNRVIVEYTDNAELMRLLDRKDRIVGVSGYDYIFDKCFRQFPGLRKKPSVGLFWMMDYEAILGLKPDLLLTFGFDTTGKREKLPGVDVVFLGLYYPDLINPKRSKFVRGVRSLGNILDAREQAERYIDWHLGLIDRIASKTRDLSEHDKPRVFLAQANAPILGTSAYSTYTMRDTLTQACIIAGGRKPCRPIAGIRPAGLGHTGGPGVADCAKPRHHDSARRRSSGPLRV